MKKSSSKTEKKPTAQISFSNGQHLKDTVAHAQLHPRSFMLNSSRFARTHFEQQRPMKASYSRPNPTVPPVDLAELARYDWLTGECTNSA